MRMNRVSPSLLLLWAVACAAMLVAWTPVAKAAACPSICKQTTIWGTGPLSTNFAPCQCTTIVNGRGSGSNSCGCGVCYILVAGRVTGYDPLSSGECPSGATNCGDCDSDAGSGSGSNKNSTSTTAPPSTQSPASNSPSPSLTSSSPSPSTPASGASSSAAGNNDSALPTVTPSPSTSPTPSPTPTRGASLNGSTDVGSSSSSSHGSVDHADGNAGTAPANASSTATPSATSAKPSSNDGLATWQIALIICSCVLVMAVVMMTITSCYCKARNRMKDNLQNEEERHEYEGYWNPNASGGITERSGGNEPLAQSAFNPATTLGGRSSFNSTHSRPNSTKNVPYSEPTYAVTVDDRIGAGMVRPPARQSLGSSNDLPGVFQPFPQRGDPRPSHEVGSRKNIAIEL